MSQASELPAYAVPVKAASSWLLESAPVPFDTLYKSAAYAVLMVIGADGDLGEASLQADLYEMTLGVSEDVAVLALVDYPGEGVARVLEVRPRQTVPLCTWEEICTGDPRPIADFLARALVTFSPETRFAVGFWGHGSGAFGDLDPLETVLDREIRFGPLGVPMSEAAVVSKPIVDREAALFRAMLPDETSGNVLTNREASSALAAAFSRARRTEPVDMVFFDTCLNGAVEVFAEVRSFTKTVVASSLLVPPTGWRYDAWLKITAEVRPESAAEWARLAVKAFEVTYDQRVCNFATHLVATSTGVDFVAAFGDLVRELVRRGPEGAILMAKAARQSQDVIFEENRELRQLVFWLRELAPDKTLRGLAEVFLERQREATICASMNPPDMELSGMTVWCPILGDRKRVGAYYRNFEFDRLTGWSELLEVGAEAPAPLPSSEYLLTAFASMTLVGVEKVEVTEAELEGGTIRLWLAIPEDRRRFAGELVEGEYVSQVRPLVLRFRNNVMMRELYRQLEELGESDEFAALKGCETSGWLVAGPECAKLAASFQKYEVAFMAQASSALDGKAFFALKRALECVGLDGVLLGE